MYLTGWEDADELLLENAVKGQRSLKIAANEFSRRTRSLYLPAKFHLILEARERSLAFFKQ